jgi:hypothetical protein
MHLYLGKAKVRLAPGFGEFWWRNFGAELCWEIPHKMLQKIGSGVDFKFCTSKDISIYI